MQNHQLYKKLCCLSVIFLMIIAGCGGGGGGDSTAPADSTSPAKAQVDFRKTVLDHFQDEVLTIQNQGNTNRSIGSVAQFDPLADPFLITDDQCSGTTLSPSETCSITIRFSPTTQDAYTDTFDIQAGSGETIMVVEISGTSAALNVSINQIDTRLYPLLRMFVSVADRYDDPVLSLANDDFLVFENGDQKDIDSFATTVTSPISTALALDSSGSIQSDLSAVEAAAKGFIDQLNLDSGTDEATIIKFAAAQEIKQSFTDGYDALVAAIEDPYIGDTSETHLYDAAWQAVEMAADPSRNEKRAVIVLSDGYDEGSVNHDLSEVIENANEKGVPIFTIGLGNTYLSVMQLMADETGGQYFVAPTSDDLNEIYFQIAEILTYQYVVEFQSSTPSGGTSLLEVEINKEDGSMGQDVKTVSGF